MANPNASKIVFRFAYTFYAFIWIGAVCVCMCILSKTIFAQLSLVPKKTLYVLTTDVYFQIYSVVCWATVFACSLSLVQHRGAFAFFAAVLFIHLSTFERALHNRNVFTLPPTESFVRFVKMNVCELLQLEQRGVFRGGLLTQPDAILYMNCIIASI